MTLLKRITLLAVVATVMFISSSASAVSWTPDYRGDPNSVYATFDLSLSGSLESGLEFSWGTSHFSTGPSIYDLDSTQPAVSETDLNTVIELPNFIDPLPLKRMRIQMFFGLPVPGDQIPVDILAFDPQPTDWDVVGSSGAGVSDAHYIDIEIWPNPDSEQITLSVGTADRSVHGSFEDGITIGGLTGLEIDTVSVPEPATMSPAASGRLCFAEA